MTAAQFERNVFVNCPFDDAYLPLLRPLLFCILDLGFRPRIALERVGSSEVRIEKIVSLIRESRFGVHDLSRLRSEEIGELARMNMPFELGLDVGSLRFGAGRFRTKRILVLETERFRYQAALSDLAGCDIAHDGDEPIEIVRSVRLWLNNCARLRAPGVERIWGRFNEFMADNFDRLSERGFSPVDIERLSVDELVVEMELWLQRRL